MQRVTAASYSDTTTCRSPSHGIICCHRWGRHDRDRGADRQDRHAPAVIQLDGDPSLADAERIEVTERIEMIDELDEFAGHDREPGLHIGDALGRTTRWLFAVFGVRLMATLTPGMLQATGLVHGVGQWTASGSGRPWAVDGVVDLRAARVRTDPFSDLARRDEAVRPSPTDLPRRALLQLGGIAAVAAALHVA